MTRFLLMAAFAFISYLVNTQTTFDTDSLIADFRHFVRLLEETHPDPYTNYGGRAFFHEQASEARWAMSDDSINTADELALRINSFIAPLQDGHTYITVPGNNKANNRFTPILFRVINDGITVLELPSTLSHLIGSRLTGIGTMPIDSIYSAASQLYAAENIIGRYESVVYNTYTNLPERPCLRTRRRP